MKVISESTTQLTATDKELAQLIAAPVMAVIGLGVVVLGVSKHAVIADVMGLVFLLIGVAMLLTRKQRTLMVDKGSGTLSFDVASILGKRHVDYPVSDVVKVQLLEQYRTSRTYNSNQTTTGGGLSFGTGNTTQFGNTQTEQTTQLILLLRDGTSIDIADGSRSMSTMGVFSKVPNQEVGQHIAGFIGVPFEAVGPPSLGQVVPSAVDAFRHQPEAPSVVPAQQPPSVVPPPSPTAPAPQAPPASPSTPLPGNPPGSNDSQAPPPPA